jgi:hypothetical protein
MALLTSVGRSTCGTTDRDRTTSQPPLRKAEAMGVAVMSRSASSHQSGTSPTGEVPPAGPAPHPKNHEAATRTAAFPSRFPTPLSAIRQPDRRVPHPDSSRDRRVSQSPEPPRVDRTARMRRRYLVVCDFIDCVLRVCVRARRRPCVHDRPNRRHPDQLTCANWATARRGVPVYHSPAHQDPRVWSRVRVDIPGPIPR